MFEEASNAQETAGKVAWPGDTLDEGAREIDFTLLPLGVWVSSME
jgi:hypothetical protein